jgi:DNA replication and repair protein RecF
LATYDERLTEAANFLHKRRLTFINQILPWVEKHYSFLVKGVGEMPGIQYESDLDTMDMKQELISRLDRDIILGRTSVGVHRDDFKFTLQGQELRSYGSQGQQKSFLIALKLAEFDCLVTRNGFKPLLLLDDIFDKLDDERIVQLMKLVAGGSFGQIFITDARPDRTLDTLAEGGIDAQRFLIEDGILNLIP